MDIWECSASSRVFFNLHGYDCVVLVVISTYFCVGGDIGDFTKGSEVSSSQMSQTTFDVKSIKSYVLGVLKGDRLSGRKREKGTVTMKLDIVDLCFYEFSFHCNKFILNHVLVAR